MQDFDILQILENIKGLTITCSCCDESFTPKQAKLFDIRKPLPKNVERVIKNEQAQINRRMTRMNKDMTKAKQELIRLADKKKKLKLRKEHRPKEIQVITKRINIGQIVEKILPATDKFKYIAKDCRTLLNPIDYLAFNGLTEKDRIDKLSFIEVKTGNAHLNKNQKQVKKAIEAGDIELRLY